MTEQLHTHPGTLCESGSRAVDLALELGRARVRIAELEAELAQRRHDQAHPYDFAIYPDAGDSVPLAHIPD